MAACATSLDGNEKYSVAIVRTDGDLSSELECVVVGDPLEQTSSCSCGQFKRTGILCGHALKVLDLMNIKLLPKHYILKRWTREARYGTQDNKGNSIIKNPNLDAMLRYKSWSHKFLNLAYQATSSPEYCILVDNTLDCLQKQLQDKFSASTSILSDSYHVQHVVPQDEGLLSAARLKKKEVKEKTSKRRGSWLDKMHKFKRKKQAKSSKQKNDGGVETQVPMDVPHKSSQHENGGGVGSQVPMGVSHKDGNAFTSYTNLLMGLSEIDDMSFQDLF